MKNRVLLSLMTAMCFGGVFGLAPEVCAEKLTEQAQQTDQEAASKGTQEKQAPSKVEAEQTSGAHSNTNNEVAKTKAAPKSNKSKKASKKPVKFYAKDFVGEMKTHKAKFEDTLVHLARDNNLGFVEIRAANPELDPWIPGKGKRIVLPTQHLLPDAKREGIVINLPEMRLYAYSRKGKKPKTYPIGIGREGLKTPTGLTTISWKKEGPIWRPTERMRKEDPELPAVVYPGPDNPMGTHALYLAWPQYAIHGTDRPFGIGRRVSSGCIRLYPEGIVELYKQTKVGTPVRVVDQAVKVGWLDDEKMYIEVHPTQAQSMTVEEEGELESYEIAPEDLKRIAKKAGEFSEYIDWERVSDAVHERSGYPVAVLDKNRKPGSWVQNDLQDLVEESGGGDDVIKLTEVQVKDGSSHDTGKYRDARGSSHLRARYND